MRNKKRASWTITLITIWLCFFSLNTVGSTDSSLPIENRYKLVTESEFDRVFENEIADFWDKYGKEGSFTGVDDVEIKHMTFVLPQEKGAVVISSGRTESYIKYKELIYDLGKQGYSIYIHDHRGQGFSGRMAENPHKGHVWDFDHYVDDLKIFYDTVVTAIEHDKIFLLAHSMGGAVATLYIEEYEDDFDAAILSSPMHEPSTGLLSNRLACAGVTLTSRIRDFFIWLFGWEPRYVVGKGNYIAVPFDKNRLTHSRVRYKTYRELYEKNSTVQLGGPTTHWVACACDGAREARENADKIIIPVLVLQGEKDTVVTARGQNEFCHNLEAAGKNRCEGKAPFVVKGAYHELFIEKDEYRIPVLTRILDFMSAQHEN